MFVTWLQDLIKCLVPFDMDLFNLQHFPTKEEWVKIKNNFPLIDRINITIAAKTKVDSTKEGARGLIGLINVSNWNRKLNNGLGKIRLSYSLLIYYSWYFSDEKWKVPNEEGHLLLFSEITEKAPVGKFFFDFYTESLYFHYFASLETLAPLFDAYYDLDFGNEKCISFNRIVERLPSEGLKKTLIQFIKQTKSARDNRNNLTHNFSFNQIDTRLIKKRSWGYESNLDYRTSSETIEEVHNMLTEMEFLLREIEKDFSNQGHPFQSI